eukprot:GHUV01043353.1.p1 GENE.GHUV01043353.1~~GHUV01043353.1.p1  ORF type:complete len:144 (-),score=26.46 GHUV01043353.1:679-1110(-)
MAPEAVKNPLKDHPNDFKNEVRYHYNAVVDSWAVGCLAYELIVGFPPFMADTQQQVVKNINTKDVQYPKKMSEEMMDFCKLALQRDPQNRATTAELIKHHWVTLHSVSTHMALSGSRCITSQVTLSLPPAVWRASIFLQGNQA